MDIKIEPEFPEVTVNYNYESEVDNDIKVKIVEDVKCSDNANLTNTTTIRQEVNEFSDNVLENIKQEELDIKEESADLNKTILNGINLKHKETCVDKWRKIIQTKCFQYCTCSDTFSEKTSLISHYGTQAGGNLFRCTFCGYRCDSKSRLKVHIRQHTGEKPYLCNFCDYKFATISNLTSHLKTHTGQKPHLCNFCGFKSAQKSSLTVHLKTHTAEKSFSCDYKSKQKSQLNRHLKVLYSCNVCDYKCIQKSDLTIHLNIHKRKRLVFYPSFKSKSSRKSSPVRNFNTHEIKNCVRNVSEDNNELVNGLEVKSEEVGIVETEAVVLEPQNHVDFEELIDGLGLLQ